MKKLITALCLIPLLGISQTKNVVTTAEEFEIKVTEVDNQLIV